MIKNTKLFLVALALAFLVNSVFAMETPDKIKIPSRQKGPAWPAPDKRKISSRQTEPQRLHTPLDLRGVLKNHNFVGFGYLGAKGPEHF